MCINRKKFGLVIVAVFMIILIGCQPVTTTVLIYVDISGSTDDERLQLLGLLDLIVEELPRNAKISVFVFDSEVRHIFEGFPKRDSVSTWGIQEKYMANETAHEGSRIDKVINSLMQELEKSSAERKACIILSDGENTGSNYKEAIDNINDPALCALWFGGVLAEYRISVRSDFVSLGVGDGEQDIAIITGLDDIEYGLEIFSRKLKQKRK